MKKQSLTVRIALLVSIFVAVLLSLVVLIIGVRLSSSIEGLVKSENIQIAQARASQLGQLLETHNAELNVLSLQSEVRTGDTKSAEAAVNYLQGKISADISSVLLAWPNGQATTASGTYIDIKERPYFKAIFSEGKDFVISDAIISKLSGKPAVMLAKPVKGADGKVRAMVAFEMQLTSLSAITGSIKVGKTGYGWVTDGIGLVIAHPKEEVLMKLQTTDADKLGYNGLNAVAKRMIAEPEGAGQYGKTDGSSAVAYWARVPNSPGWALGLNLDVKEVNETASTLITLLLIILVFGVIMAIILSILIARSIVKPLQLVVQAMGLFSKGDLTLSGIDYAATRKVVKRGDEIGTVGKSLDTLLESLNKVIFDIRMATEQVSRGSEELSSSAQGLSQGANEQAASIEELSASVEELASTIKQNADNTSQADALARRVALSAEASGQAVSQTVASMTEIAGKISIIEEIARQTNLLALNAAIEAARAGEAGKGFAVVASEVRKLAERSAKAAGEINELSKSSVSVAAEAGKRLNELVPDIKKTAELIQEISAASAEQSSGGEQIAKGVSQMDQVVQQNASVSEELASTAEELAAQSEQLRDAVAFFKIAENASDASPAKVERGEPRPPASARKPAALEPKAGTGTQRKALPKASATGSRSITLPASSSAPKSGSASDASDSDFEEF